MNDLLNLKAFIKAEHKIVNVIGVDYIANDLYYVDENNLVLSVNVSDVILLLGTGFEDANNNEIFEGDVLIRLDYKSDELYIVERHGYSNNIFLKKESTGSIFNIELFVGSFLEIIGNIYASE